jgi:NAD+ synthase
VHQEGLRDFWRERGWTAKKEIQHIQRWIGRYFKQNQIENAVLGLSGGLDSSVVATLLSNALESEKITGVLLPDGEVTDPKDVADATRLAEEIGLTIKRYDISPLVSAFVKQDPEIVDRGPGGEYSYRNQYGNLKARVRMIKLYEVSQMMPERSVVVGTTDKSEWLMGYFTKYGDGGVDLEPIIKVYKTQVRELARELGLPKDIIQKKSSPNLVPGLTAENELGFSYEELDLILTCLIEGGYMVTGLQAGKDLLFERYGIDGVNVDRVVEKLNGTVHKRHMPACPPVHAILNINAIF